MGALVPGGRLRRIVFAAVVCSALALLATNGSARTTSGGTPHRDSSRGNPGRHPLSKRVCSKRRTDRFPGRPHVRRRRPRRHCHYVKAPKKSRPTPSPNRNGSSEDILPKDPHGLVGVL